MTSLKNSNMLHDSVRIPHRQFIGQAAGGLISSLLFTGNRNDTMNNWRYGTLFAFKIPKFQRKLVWTTRQSSDFIQSIYLGVALGTYMYNMHDTDSTLDWLLLDGQQRLNAINLYINTGPSAIACRGEDGLLYKWNELTKQEQSHFLRISFPYIETFYDNDQQCKAAYDRHNFGGTPHDASQYS